MKVYEIKFVFLSVFAHTVCKQLSLLISPVQSIPSASLLLQWPVVPHQLVSYTVLPIDAHSLCILSKV